MTPRALYAPARLAGTPLLRTQSDERLVDLVRAGNDGAFEAIVARYRRGLTRYCSGILPGGRADDAVQQTFLRAYDALRASEGEMNLRPWLYRIAHNQALNGLRDRALSHEELSEDLDGVQRPDQAVEGREHLGDVIAAVSALPERQRDAIVLRELEGRSYEEIAAELGVTGGAVRALLHRARGTLRAGVTALTPYGLMGRLPWAAEGGDGMAVRVAELCGAGAGGAVAAKACATVLVTGAVVGGVASSPDTGTSESRAISSPREESAKPPPPAPPAPRPGAIPTIGDDSASGDDSSGRGRGGDDRDDDRSGPGGGGETEDEDEDEDRSGRGDGEAEIEVEEPEEPREDNSGPGSANSGSGSSGSDDSGSDSSGSGSSGSDSSGSGSSGSDDSSGSG